ncbi:MAG: glycosyltransferase family 2 protein [Stellaceae bacterium]
MGERARTAAVIPVLDEAGAIGTVIAEIPRTWIDDIVVVDGGSRDGTAAVAAAAGARVVIERERGYGRACALGAAAAAAGGAEILVFLDGDGGDRPEMIPVLLAPLLDGSADFTIGSRTRGTRERGSMGLHQVLAGRLFGILCRLACGARYSDMCAFRAIRAEALWRLQMRELTYGWNLEMQVRAARAGLRIRELPVPHRRRLAGRSKVAGTLRGTLKAGLRLAASFLRIACEPRVRR